MSDLSTAQGAQLVKVVGSNQSGVDANYVNASPNGDQYVRDSINNGGVNGAISVGTSAVEAKVNAGRLTNRKNLTICPTNGVVYWGYSSGVTVATGTPIFKNQLVSLAFTDNVPIYLIAASTVDVRVTEGA